MISHRILFLVPVLLVQCVAAPQISESERFFAEQAAANELRKAELANEAEANNAAGNPLIVRSVYVRGNSAGGQEPSVHFCNTSGKPIKYVTFFTTFYNSVGDKAKCKITGVSTAQLKSVGPFEHGRNKHEFWDPSIYCSGTYCMEIDSVKIDFMDGTTERLDKSAVDRCGSPEGWNTWEGIGRANAEKAVRLGWSNL